MISRQVLCIQAKVVAAGVMSVILASCQSVAPKHQQAKPIAETQGQQVSALQTVAEGLTNTSLTKTDLNNLAKQLKKDPEARAAVEKVNEAFSISQSGVKYCPVDGKRFNERVEICPEHEVKLEIVD